MRRRPRRGCSSCSLQMNLRLRSLSLDLFIALVGNHDSVIQNRMLPVFLVEVRREELRLEDGAGTKNIDDVTCFLMAKHREFGAREPSWLIEFRVVFDRFEVV